MSYFDNFSGYPTQNACLADNATFGPWKVIFGSVADGGCTQIATQTAPPYPVVLQQKPQASAGSVQTFGALTSGPAVAGSLFTIAVTVRTVAQLRTGSPPNNWEVAWIGWDFSYSGSATFYYYTIKESGTELGRLNSGVQTTLATGSTNYNPALWHTVLIQQSAVTAGSTATLTTWVDGTADIAFTDNSASALATGQVACYCEDSQVQFTNWALNLPTPQTFTAGSEGLTYPQYIDEAAGRTLTTAPGGTYSVNVAPGNPGLAATPGDGRWTAA